MIILDTMWEAYEVLRMWQENGTHRFEVKQ